MTTMPRSDFDTLTLRIPVDLFAAHRNAQATADNAYDAAKRIGPFQQALAYHLTYQRVMRREGVGLVCGCSECRAEFGE